MPNHGIMVLALLYGGHDFNQDMHIVNTCGRDTDGNSGNSGCLVAISVLIIQSNHWRVSTIKPLAGIKQEALLLD